ncbi:MAG: pyridoxal phosphate-dependent aminotransferase [Deltaproteobacteria bacterium]|nr:pyridoxal phosphate-dependent aminotransferase [Deltaproteobacteria bacterium]
MPAAKEIREAILQGSWIRKMFEEGAVLKNRRGEENIHDFTLGNPYGEPPPALAEEIARLAASPPPGLHKYMSNAGYPEVRAAVARDLGGMTGLPFTGENVVMTVGAAGALAVALRALLSPGDEVVVLSPFFVEYLSYVRNAGGVPVTAETDERFQPDLHAVESALTPRTRAIIINTPNNPSGAVYPAKTLAALDGILSAAGRRFGTTIYAISDEPYRKIVFRGKMFTPPASMIRNALVAYSHSKDLNLPGERIGYLAVSPVAADAEEVVEACVHCNRVLGFVNAPAFFQLAVEKFQGHAADVSVYQENRDTLLGVFSRTGIACVPPGGAFYLFPKSPTADEMVFVSAAKDEGILVVPGRGFGRSGHFRVAFCVSTGTVRRSIPAWERLGVRFQGGEDRP